MSVNSIGSIGARIDPAGSSLASNTEVKGSGRSFGESMAQALQETDQLLTSADTAAAGVADGSTDAVEALITLSKAELALRHVVSMSTRALESYREVMRLQI